MPLIVWIVLGVALIGFLVYRAMVPSLDRVVDRAVGAQDVTPIVETIVKKSERARPNAFNHAIRRLWDNYHRDLAVKLVKELAFDHGTSAITQYWLKQVMTVEPKMARKSFSKDFLHTYYMPEVAAKCGHVG